MKINTIQKSLDTSILCMKLSLNNTFQCIKGDPMHAIQINLLLVLFLF